MGIVSTPSNAPKPLCTPADEPAASAKKEASRCGLELRPQFVDAPLLCRVHQFQRSATVVTGGLTQATPMRREQGQQNSRQIQGRDGCQLLLHGLRQALLVWRGFVADGTAWQTGR